MNEPPSPLAVHIPHFWLDTGVGAVQKPERALDLQKSLCGNPAFSPLGERVARDGAFISRRGPGEGVPTWIASLFIELFTQAPEGRLRYLAFALTGYRYRLVL